MAKDFTLPSLQSSLDRLAVAQTLALANRQIELLFGVNDVAIARVKRFAEGHNCTVTYAGGCVVFHKAAAGKA
jgi:hypothetical protein